MAQLICENAVLGYEGKAVTSTLNFTVNKGDYLYIIGENGSGKSTLIKNILGLRKPMEGSIMFGDDLQQREVGYLPQQTQIQRDFPASVCEIVLSGCLNRLGMRPFYSAKERSIAKESMEKMEIAQYANRCYRELSGGQQQRVLLARALCATRKMLLLDEPVAGLDPKVSKEMYDLILKLNKEENITIIMVSHDIQAAVKYASHILHMKDEPIFFGTRDAYLLSNAGQAFVNLGEEK